MAFQSIWYFTNLNPKIVDIIEEDIHLNYKNNLDVSRVGDISSSEINMNKRNSKQAWIPTTHWISGFLWHYVQKANRENFLYDITNIDGECLQYTLYNQGGHYGWHSDQDITSYYKPISKGNRDSPENKFQDFVNENCEKVRKLSFSLLLSDPEDYDGGNLQLFDSNGKPYISPRTKGTMIVFDSRANHRVQKVTRGVRKSIVGWVVGPRFR